MTSDQPAEWKGQLKGHGLQNEGWAHNDNGQRIWVGTCTGRGKCSCGSLSPTMMSDYARKRWHRQHKAEIAALAAEDGSR